MQKSMPPAICGFTLIELMIVVAIIAILTAIALPVYRLQQARSAEGACQFEMKSYANMSLAALANNMLVMPAPRQACLAADDASDAVPSITGTPRPPGTRMTTCDMRTGNCTLAP